MLETFRPGGSLAWDFLWQSTLILGLGLAATVFLPRRPARRTGCCSWPCSRRSSPRSSHRRRAARAGGCSHPSLNTNRPGSRPPQPPARPGQSPTARRWLRVDELLNSPRHRLAPAILANHRESRERRTLTLACPDRLLFPRSRPPLRTDLLPSHGEAALGVWLMLAILAAIRLVLSLMIGLGVLRRSRQVSDTALVAAAARSAARLGVHPPPELRASSHVDCPAIWCWGRRPVIVLPEAAEPATTVDWAGVFCHELAHWLRRDHWSSLLGELLTCCPPLASAGLVGQASTPAAQRAGLRRLGARDRPAGHGLRRVAPGPGSSASRASGPDGGLEPSRSLRPDPAYPG